MLAWLIAYMNFRKLILGYVSKNEDNVIDLKVHAQLWAKSNKTKDVIVHLLLSMY